MVVAVDEQRHFDVFEHLHPGLGALPWPDTRDLLAVQPLPLAPGQLIQAAPVVADLTVVRRDEARGDLQQRGLAGAAGAEEADDLPALQIERHLVDGDLVAATFALEAL